MTEPCRSLAGQAILVTRPRHQAQALCDGVIARGGEPCLYPVMEIEPVLHDAELLQRLATAAEFDLFIFVSANAVVHGLQALALVGGLPGDIPLAAVGAATARALQAAGRPIALVPETGYTSESLLALPELQQVEGQRILILRGEGGRARLGEVLRERGAEVVYAEVYRRQRPEAGGLPTPDWRRIAAATATSGEILENLLALIPDQARRWLQQRPLVVVSGRIAEQAEALGFEQVRVAREASDTALLEALMEAIGQMTDRVPLETEHG